MLKQSILFTLLVLFNLGCETTSKNREAAQDQPKTDQPIEKQAKQKYQANKKEKKLIGHGFTFENNGKSDKDTVLLSNVFTKEKVSIDVSSLITKDFQQAMKKNNSYLNKVKHKELQATKNLSFGYNDVLKVGELLRTIKPGQTFEDLFETHKIYGEDKMSNVHFTSYFIPILKVKDKPDSEYKYPLYRKPKNWNGTLPTRVQIDKEGALKGKGLEIAYSKSLVDIHFMMVQGSGYVEYRDGSQKLFSYGGKNGHKYVSLGRYLVEKGEVPAEEISLSAIKEWCANHPEQVTELLYRNPSYVFFTPSDSQPIGAANVELTDLHSVAVDKTFLPLGTILLGKVPVLDTDNKFARHEYRLLISQDVGGAIKGAGHIDIYAGVGEQGKRLADAMHHYGQIWLLLPKK